ncbi:MAG: class I SAM-dependent RNA methyltransferase [Pseudobdellovibrionaceae bacterium]|nr:MAG: class I SAM-dependent RNA methyltransferase [Pseudobdellovibrionaceae bacterium]
MNVGDELELRVEKLSYNGGRGVSKHRGFVVFVEGAAPEETVKARITTVKKTFAEAKVVEVISSSMHRRTPPCPVAHQCGGCPLQHVEYSEQLFQKQQIINDFVSRNLPDQTLTVLPILPSPNEFRYRNRIQLHSVNGLVGYYARGTNSFIPIEDCLISEESLIEALPEVRSQTQNQDKMTRFEVARGLDNKIHIRKTQKDPGTLLFAQVNAAQNEKLIETVVMWAQESSDQFSQIFDLYAGAGNITWPLAKAFPNISVTGVELSDTSCSMGRKWMDPSLGARATLECADVADFLGSLDPRPALMVLDPPRQGCENQVMDELLRLQPPIIIYVSCNPSTLMRDLGKLKSLYNVVRLQPIDMFPQSDHIESIVLLKHI